MFLFKTKNGFAGISISESIPGSLISNCIHYLDEDYEDVLDKIIDRNDTIEDFFAYGVFTDSKTLKLKFETFDVTKVNKYEYVLYTDYSYFHNGYDTWFYDDNFSEEEIKREVEYEFYKYHLNPPELFYDLFNNELNHVGRVCGFYGKTIEESKILDSIKDIKYFIGFEYDEDFGSFQKQYFLDESRFFKKDLEKIIKVEDFEDIIQLSCDEENFLEFIEKDNFINSFSDILKNMKNSSLKENLNNCFNKNNPSRQLNLDKFKKAEILDLFFR